MFGINFSFVAQLALAAATGGTSMAITMAAKQIAMQAAMQIIQKMGEELGLPQSMIDMAKSAFAVYAGETDFGTQSNQQMFNDIGSELNLSPADIGHMERAFNSQVDAMVEQFLDDIRNDRFGMDEDGRPRGRDRASQSSNKSFIMMIAEILGSKLNEAARELKNKADSTDWKDGKDMSEYNALVQQFNTLMNSVNAAIKSIGEALTTMARKQ